MSVRFAVSTLALSLYTACSDSTETKVEDYYPQVPATVEDMREVPCIVKGKNNGEPIDNCVMFKLTDPAHEFDSLCDVLFGVKDHRSCLALTDTGLGEMPIGTSALYPYSKGIVAGTDGYSYENAAQIFKERLAVLRGAQAYQLGTYACGTEGRDGGCFFVDDEHRVALLDTPDDVTNMIGVWYMLRDELARGAELDYCGLVAASWGTKELQLCGMYYAHNMVNTPVGLQMRGVPDYLSRIGRDDMPYPMSSCKARQP